MKRTPLLVLALLISFLISTPLCSAHEFELKLNKHVYDPGDIIIVTAGIRNTESRLVQLAVSAVLRDLEMQSPPMPIYYQVELQAGENETVTLYEITVDESLYSGEYVVDATLIENDVGVYEDETSFTIQGLPKDMNVEILLCKDSSYTEKSLVFIKGENIYINYTSEPPNPMITATLTFPDNSENALTFPLHMKAEDVGSYTLHFTASKKGYRDFGGAVNFAVLEKEPEPEEISEPSAAPSSHPSFPATYLGILIVTLAAVAIILVYRKRHAKLQAALGREKPKQKIWLH